jgi:hypothetical protein
MPRAKAYFLPEEEEDEWLSPEGDVYVELPLPLLW